MNKIIGLVRVSTADQAAEQRAGIARQREAIDRIVKAKGGHLDDLIVISDVSGSDLSQTNEWRDRIVPKLKRGIPIACDAIDRIVRPDRFDFSALATIQQANVPILTPGGEVDLTRPEGFMLGGIGALFGGLEKMNLKRRTFAGKEAIRRRGGWASAGFILPCAITYNRKTGAWGYDSDKGKVEDAYRLLVHEGIDSIAELSRRTGLSRNGIRYILSNAIYKGWMVWDHKNAGEKFTPKTPGRQAGRRRIKRTEDEVIKVQVFGGEGQPPALVDAETWAKAVAILERKRADKSKKRATPKPNIYFSGFLYSENGTVIYGKPNKRGFDYYMTRWYGGLKPEIKPLPAKLANVALDTILARLTDSKLIHDAAMKEFHKDRRVTTEDLDALNKEKKAVDAKLNRLTTLFVDGAIEREQYDAQYKRLQGDLQRVKDRLERTKPEDPDAEKRLKEHLDGAYYMPNHMTYEKKRAWLTKYIDRIVVSESGVESVLLKLPEKNYMFTEPHRGAWTWAKLGWKR